MCRYCQATRRPAGGGARTGIERQSRRDAKRMVRGQAAAGEVDCHRLLTAGFLQNGIDACVGHALRGATRKQLRRRPCRIPTCSSNEYVDRASACD